MNNRPLGRKVPTDFKHVTKYPLQAVLPKATVTPAPMVWGVNWYSDFDNPVRDKDGKYWVGRSKNLGSIRGGHAVCSPHTPSRDLLSWYTFYNQGQEGACVGFASSRMMSLLNRKRYDARWLYKAAQVVDEWEGEDYEGTSVRAAMDVLRDSGHRRSRSGKSAPVSPTEGIQENRWAVTVDEVLASLGNDYYSKIGAIPFLNSWGKSYPRLVWMPCETWTRLLREYGEATRIVDREVN